MPLGPASRNQQMVLQYTKCELSGRRKLLALVCWGCPRPRWGKPAAGAAPCAGKRRGGSSASPSLEERNPSAPTTLTPLYAPHKHLKWFPAPGSLSVWLFLTRQSSSGVGGGWQGQGVQCSQVAGGEGCHPLGDHPAWDLPWQGVWLAARGWVWWVPLREGSLAPAHLLNGELRVMAVASCLRLGAEVSPDRSA